MEIFGAIASVPIVGILLGGAVVLGGIYIVRRIFRGVRGFGRSVKSAVDLVSQLSDLAKQEPTVEPKTVAGQTSLLLPRINNDFPEFHKDSAENAIRTFLTEYIHIRYGKQKNFQNARISDRNPIYVDKEKEGEVSSIRFNRIAIYDYTKAREYATVTYRCSVGFDVDGARVESRYQIKYTLQLSQNSMAMKAMVCPSCGGDYSSTSDSLCPYCGVPVIKDTILNWYVTELSEI